MSLRSMKTCVVGEGDAFDRAPYQARAMTFLPTELHLGLHPFVTAPRQAASQRQLARTSGSDPAFAQHDHAWQHSGRLLERQYQRVGNKEVAAQRMCRSCFGDSITKSWTLLRADGKPVWENVSTSTTRSTWVTLGHHAGLRYRVNNGNLDFPRAMNQLSRCCCVVRTTTSSNRVTGAR